MMVGGEGEYLPGILLLILFCDYNISVVVIFSDSVFTFRGYTVCIELYARAITVTS